MGIMEEEEGQDLMETERLELERDKEHHHKGGQQKDNEQMGIWRLLNQK